MLWTSDEPVPFHLGSEQTRLHIASLLYTNKVHEFPDLLVLTAHLDVLSDQWVDRHFTGVVLRSITSPSHTHYNRFVRNLHLISIRTPLLHRFTNLEVARNCRIYLFSKGCTAANDLIALGRRKRSQHHI